MIIIIIVVVVVVITIFIFYISVRNLCGLDVVLFSMIGKIYSVKLSWSDTLTWCMFVDKKPLDISATEALTAFARAASAMECYWFCEYYFLLLYCYHCCVPQILCHYWMMIIAMATMYFLCTVNYIRQPFLLPPTDDFCAVMIDLRTRGKIIGTVLCYIVYCVVLCTVISILIRAVLTYELCPVRLRLCVCAFTCFFITRISLRIFCFVCVFSCLLLSWVWLLVPGMRNPCFLSDCYCDSSSGTKKLGLLRRLWAQNQTLTLGLIVWHNDCVLKDDLREIFKFL